MRKWFAVFAAVALLAGCGTRQSEPPVTTETQSAARTAPKPRPRVRPPVSREHYIRNVYPDQLRQYYTALLEQWPEGVYREMGRSPVGALYAEGDPLVSVGFALEDLDGDGFSELIIGAIRGQQEDPRVFEIWTAPGEEPGCLLCAGPGERWYLADSPGGGMLVLCRETAGDRLRLLRLGGDALHELFSLRPASDGKGSVLESTLIPGWQGRGPAQWTDERWQEQLHRLRYYPFHLYTP